MKKALFFCIIGLLCLGTYSYADDFKEVGIGGVTTPLNSMLNIVHKGETFDTYRGATGTVTVTHGTNYVVSNGNTLFTKEVLVGDSIIITTESDVRHTVTQVAGDAGVITFTPNYEGPTYNGSAILVSRPIIAIDNDEVSGLFTLSRGGRIGIGKFPSENALMTVNSSIQFGSSAPGTNAMSVLCWTSLGTIGRCTNAPNSSGKCGCAPIN